MQRNFALLLGVGSPFGADRLGWLAVETLAPKLCAQFPALFLRCEQCDRPGSRLLTLLGGTDAAVIVDAMHSGAPAGTVRRFSADELGSDTGLVSSHGFGVAESLTLGRVLARSGVLHLPQRLAVVGIELDDGVEPEHTVAQWFPALHETVSETLRQWQAAG